MKRFPVAAFVLAFALPGFAQVPEPPEPATPPPAQPEAPPTESPKPESSVRSRFFYGGGVGLAFGTVDYVELAPLVGFKVLPRFDIGAQPFYRWTNDGRYGTDLEYSDYGARLFARVRIWSSIFAEGDYEYTSYEYLNGNGTTSRDTYDTFLLGGGYTIWMGNHAGFYFSALYDFSYDSGDLFSPYDSPVRFQAGVSVWF